MKAGSGDRTRSLRGGNPTQIPPAPAAYDDPPRAYDSTPLHELGERLSDTGLHREIEVAGDFLVDLFARLPETELGRINTVFAAKMDPGFV